VVYVKTVLGIGAAILLSIATSLPAKAIPITVTFTASGFPAGAPTDPVTGSITYDAASTTSNINVLTSVNLTIDGHTYNLGELAFVSGVDQEIGGALNGVGGLVAGTNDFGLVWDTTSLVPLELVYTDASDTKSWGTLKFDQFSVVADTVPLVPEPTSLLLLGAGMIGLASARRRG
jgi:hypothetical protein